jgi:hypothetical protein
MHRTRRTLFVLVVGLALLALVVAPASGRPGKAPVKFGYNLTTNTQPSNSNPPHKCAEVDPEEGDLADAPCTRMQFSASAAPGGIKAPSNGTITQIWVIAGHAGSFTPVVGFLSNISGTQANGKITAKGPVLTHGSSFTSGSTYTIFKFTGLSIKVKKNEYLGIQSKSTSAVRCNSGGAGHFVFQPPLTVRSAPVANPGHDGCQLLIEAVMTPAS